MRATRRTRVTALTLAVGVATVVAGCGTDATNTDAGGSTDGECELPIGTLGPLTGPAADFGLSMEGTANFVAAEANAAGGVEVGDQTCQVTISTYDTGYTSAGAAAGANEFASQGINFVIGPLGATELTGMKPVADRHDMLLAANGFGRDALETQYPLVFHLGPGPFVWSGPIIREAKTIWDFQTAAVIAPNDQSGDDIAIINAEQFAAEGVGVTRETYPRGTQDFAPIVARLLQGNPDVIDFASSPAGDVGTMINQLRTAGYDGIFARLGGDSTAEILRVAPLDTVQNMFYYAPVDFEDPEVAALAEEYEEVTGQPATGLALGWIPGARALLRAITEAGTIEDTSAVADAYRTDDLADETLGQGIWTGEEQFGVNQEMSWPFNIGIIEDGQEPVSRPLEAD